MDKAGAYGIQGAAGKFVEKIVGPFDNVVGLPMQAVSDFLKEEFKTQSNNNNFSGLGDLSGNISNIGNFNSNNNNNNANTSPATGDVA